jgi:hypothetical protein
MSKRLVRWGLVGLVAAILAFVAYAAWLTLQVKGELGDSVDAASDLKSALKAGDDKAADKALASLRSHAEAAQDDTGSPTWSVISHVPVVGDDARAIRTVSSVAVDLAGKGIAPLIDAGALDMEGFAPKGGHIDLARISKLSDPISESATAFAAAEKRLDAVDSDSLAGPLASKWKQATRDITDAANGLEAGRVASEVLPAMLGADGPRKQLLVFQTNAEPRSPGGMPGSLATINATDGHLKLERQRAASSFPELKDPILPITKEEKARFGKQLGTFVMDAAFTPHFPREAELIAARWTKEYNEKLDGVVAIDPVALGYLMEATGPITVNNVKLTSGNVAEELLNRAYLRTQDPKLQDLWFQAVAGSVFQRLSDGPVDGEKLVQGLARGVGEGRIYVNSFHPKEQAELASTTVAGEMPSATTEAPEAGVFLNDSSSGKMGWYLDYDVSVKPSCDGTDRRGLVATMEIRSTLKPGTKLPESITGPGTFGTAKGEHLVSVDLFGPQEGTLGRIKFDGEDQQDAEFSHYRHHPSTSVYVFLEPGSSHTITWTMNTAKANSQQPVVVRVSAGVHPADESVVVPSC